MREASSLRRSTINVESALSALKRKCGWIWYRSAASRASCANACAHAAAVESDSEVEQAPGKKHEREVEGIVGAIDGCADQRAALDGPDSGLPHDQGRGGGPEERAEPRAGHFGRREQPDGRPALEETPVRESESEGHSESGGDQRQLVPEHARQREGASQGTT